MKVLIFLAVISSGFCEIVITNFNMEINPVIAKAIVTSERVKGKGSVFNTSVQNFVTVTKLLVYLKINLEDDTDTAGSRKEILNTVLDMGKVFDGIVSNPIAKSVVDMALKSFDFEAKFPFSPGTYNATNLYADDTFIPLISPVQGSVDAKVVGKIMGNKATMFFGRFKFRGNFLGRMSLQVKS